MSSIGSFQDGLEVTRPDEMKAEEIEAHRARYVGSNRGLLDSFESSLQLRPDVLKRHRARMRHHPSAIEPQRPVIELCGPIHEHTITAFREGAAYGVRLAQTNGPLRTDILDVLAVAEEAAGEEAAAEEAVGEGAVAEEAAGELLAELSAA